MTWIRWDTEAPRSDVVAFLADRLGLRPVYALGHYNAVCCGFGDHRVDGRIDAVSDAQLERWAEWPGKRGRFAAAIREWCALSADSPGELRGWWRQKALLRKQDLDRQKPDGRTKSREGLTGDSDEIPPQSPADPSGATNERTNTRTDELPRSVIPAEPERVLNRYITSEPDRDAVAAFLELVPATSRYAWVQSMAAWLEGIGFPGGRRADPDALATACRDFVLIPVGERPILPSPTYFRACVARAMREGTKHNRTSPTDVSAREARTAQAAREFLEGK